MEGLALVRLDLGSVRTRAVEDRDFDFVLGGRLDIFLIEEDRGYWESDIEREDTLSALREDIQLKRVLIAEITNPESGSDEYVGFIGMIISNKVPFGVNYGDMETAFCWVSSSWVVPKYRGSGVGKLLYRAVESYAKSQGVNEVWCDVYMCNPSSRAFHEKLGFSPHVMLYRKELSPEQAPAKSEN